MAEVSLLDKALRVEGLARTYAEGATERREREQTAGALAQVEAALSLLVASVHAAQDAAALGLSIDGITENARTGLANLRARSGDGMLPSTRVLQAARNKLDASRTVLDKALDAAWRPWAAAQITSLPQSNKTFATPLSRQAIEQDIQDLTRLAARKPPTAQEIATFARVHTRVRQTLDQLSGDENIAGLLARMDGANVLTLADLTDAELHLLRSQTQVADQIELRRR
jgi:hypothetical protein